MSKTSCKNKVYTALLHNKTLIINNLPKIDLHGFDRESARVITNDFIEEALKLNYDKIIIIHGIGTGIVKESVHQTLSKNKKVLSYKLDNINTGCTIVTLNKEPKN